MKTTRSQKYSIIEYNNMVDEYINHLKSLKLDESIISVESINSIRKKWYILGYQRWVFHIVKVLDNLYDRYNAYLENEVNRLRNKNKKSGDKL